MKKKLLLITILCFLGIFSVKAMKLDVYEVPNKTYVIGKHMFTRTPNEETGYNGTLTTKLIMLASQTTTGDADDMIIYYKDVKGTWVNAVTGETIEDVKLDEIEYYNLAKIPNRDLVYNKREVLEDKVEYTLEMKDSNEADFSNMFGNKASATEAKVYYDLYGSADESELNNTNFDLDDETVTITYGGEVIKSKVALEETYKVEVDKDSSYFYRPNLYIDDDGYKIYLFESPVFALDSGVTVNNRIVDNKMEVELAGIDDYTIEEVTLYVPIDMENEEDVHISPADISNALKQVTNKDELMLETNLGLAANLMIVSSAIDYDGQKYQIANGISGELGKKVSISDLGNVENKENSYIVLVKYSNEEYGTQRTVISNVVNGVVAQELVPAGEFELHISSEEPTEFLTATMFTGTMLNLVMSMLNN